MPRIALSKSKIHVTCRLPIEVYKWLNEQNDDRTAIITKAIEQYRVKKEKNNYALRLRELKRDRDDRDNRKTE